MSEQNDDNHNNDNNNDSNQEEEDIDINAELEKVLNNESPLSDTQILEYHNHQYNFENEAEI